MESENSVRQETVKKPVDPKKRKRKVQNSRNIKYKDVIQGLQHMKRTDGFRGLFKGNGAYIAQAMSFSIVRTAVHYPLARIIQLRWQQPGKENAKPPILLTGGIEASSLMIATAVAYPMDMVRGRLSVQTGKSPYQYRGIYHALSTIAREEGPRALYKGCLPFTIGQVVYAGLNFTVYQSLRIISSRVLRQMLEATPGFDYTDMKPEDMKPEMLEEMRAYGKKLPFFYVFAFANADGGVEKSSSIIACDGNNKAAIEFTGMCDAFKKTIRNDGFKALYRGSVPNLLLKAFPASVVASVIHYGLMEGLGLEYIHILTFSLELTTLAVSLSLSDSSILAHLIVSNDVLYYTSSLTAEAQEQHCKI
ncbi:hypothetical protein C5167_028405 [Papaver somniferum]|nr:hypothetical protein C5167_028405 [Papaver somniferum]